MQEGTTSTVSFSSTSDVLTDILRQGAQQMLATAIEAEVAEWIEKRSHVVDGDGHRQVVRNGYLPERKITTGVGEVEVRQPRVHDRRDDESRERFTSKILPPYLRKTKSSSLGCISKLHDIWQADTREHANEAFDLFVDTYQAKYPKAVECLSKDREALLAFYDFPAEHWLHLRTTNPIESTFATVRHRHRRTKGNGSRSACLAMVFKLTQAAEKKWRLLNGSKWIPDVIRGVRFVDGVREAQTAA